MTIDETRLMGNETTLEGRRQFELAPGLPLCFGWLLSRYFLSPAPPITPPPEPYRAVRLTYAEALALLRRAVGLAVAYGEIEIGSPMRVKHDPKGKAFVRQVSEVRLLVRQGNLHQALVPLVAGDVNKAQQLLKPMLQAQGLITLNRARGAGAVCYFAGCCGSVGAGGGGVAAGECGKV